MGATWFGLVHASGQSLHSQQQPVTCEDGRIAEIVIDNQSVFDMSDPNRNGRFVWAYRLANDLHMRTRREVVKRELLFSVGDCHDPAVLEDSERLLRAFDFLADAHVYSLRGADGDIQVRVDTQDEWSTRIEPRVVSDGSVGLRGLRIVEDNLFGAGQHVGLFYEREREGTIFGASYATPQLFNSRWDLELEVARTDVGHSYREAITYPFVGETGRLAFRQVLDRQDRHFELLMPDEEDELARVWVPVSRERFELGGAFRWGRERYRHTLLGLAIAGERIQYPSEAVFADDERQAVQTLLMPVSWAPVSSVRAMLLAGQQNIYFVRRRALDTVNGNEDIRLGVEAEGTFGPTLPVLSDERDAAVGLRLYAAGEIADRVILGGQFAFDARRAYESIDNVPEWHDILGQLTLWGYARRTPNSPHLWVFSAAALGGWHSRVPFQLSLGGEAGLRGYPQHVDPGGRRIVGSLEHRAYLGWPSPQLFDLGTVAFVDVGRIWPGHAPFGVESRVRASVGAGIRAAFPPGSRQTFRLDVGFPVERSVGLRDLTLTIGVGQAIGRGVDRRDRQLLRSARYGLPMSAFEIGRP